MLNRSSLENLYLELLRDLYSAEKQLNKSLPRLAREAQAPELRKILDDFASLSASQVLRIEDLFSRRLGSPRGKKCVGMEGLIEEAKEMLANLEPGDVMDAGLTLSAWRFTAYTITSYYTARAWGARLGDTSAVEQIERNLREAIAINERLTRTGEDPFESSQEFEEQLPGDPTTDAPPPED